MEIVNASQQTTFLVVTLFLCIFIIQDHLIVGPTKKNSWAKVRKIQNGLNLF